MDSWKKKFKIWNIPSDFHIMPKQDGSAELMPWNPFTKSISWDTSSADASHIADILLTDFKEENQFLKWLYNQAREN